MQNPLYFAYGSNILTKRLQQRVGYVTKHSTLKLQGYKLIFNAPGSFGSFANIIPNSQSFVEGVLYDLSQEQQRELDGYEGWPRQYKKFYFLTDYGRICYVYAYTGNAPETLPPVHYLNIILRGLKEHNLEHTLKALKKYKKLNNLKICRKKVELKRKIDNLLVLQELKKNYDHLI